ncbi:ferredoxin-type protein NapG [Magnetococcus sp. PR-3]|uniref:ferredoxin-type protein NapG n=1 Tax=Magnetococcus sp. PR-3 TaxID=3120355 RepID=UPI002FCE470A
MEEPVTPPQESDDKGVDRRGFFQNLARGVAGSAVFGSLLWTHAKTASAMPAQSLRPPGALVEDDFLKACVRCGLCVRACPYKILKLAQPGDEEALGTPFFEARTGPCEMCEDIPCVPACPTGALDRSLKEIDDARMGIAVLSDQETCLNFLGLRCDVCYRVCPAIDKAITLEMRRDLRSGHHAKFIPTVHSEHCTGCGKCEEGCVLPKAAIKVMPIELAKGASAEHYKLGWEEKDKQGESLLPDLIKLPIRRPGDQP